MICTYNNAALLDAVLAAVSSQIVPDGGDWGCLVVDNNCTDESSEVLQAHMLAGRIPSLQVIHEPVQGLTKARLRGVRSTTAEWIAFIDDDCILREDWVAHALRFAKAHPTAGAFGGRVVLEWEVAPRAYVKRHGYCFAEQNHGSDEKTVPFLVGAGLVLRRSAVEASGWTAGPLLEDRVGTKLISGGDVEIVSRIRGAGYELWYTPECELRHRIPERRTTFRYLLAMTRGLGKSQAYADALAWEGSLGSWAFTAGGQVGRALAGTVPQAARAVRKRTRAAELLLRWSFLLGQGVGTLAIVGRSALHRSPLGQARRGSRAPAHC